MAVAHPLLLKDNTGLKVSSSIRKNGAPPEVTLDFDRLQAILLPRSISVNKKAFFALYVASLLVPACFYLGSKGWNLSGSGVSAVLGVCAFVLVCNQLILASRPPSIVAALGQKGLRSLHSLVPVIIIVLAVAHRLIKASIGFDVESFQADLGATGLFLIIALSLLAFLLIAAIGGKVGESLKALRSGLSKKPGISYKGSRAVHAALALTVPLLCLHFFLASSADFSRNPIGALWLAVYALFSLYLFVKYRISGRAPGKEKR
jgi:predicted ferric reductase